MGSPAVTPTIGSVTTLLTLVEALASDPEAKADYAAGPDAYLQRHGFGGLSPADVNEAVLHASNTLPAPAAAQVDHSNGLDSVAEVDPGSFHADPSDAYEDDLFGHDPGEAFEDGIEGFGDGPDALDGPIEHGTPDHADSADPDSPDHNPDHQPEPGASTQPDPADADDDGSSADAVPQDGQGPSLSSLQDPHALDGDAVTGPGEATPLAEDPPGPAAEPTAEVDGDEAGEDARSFFDDGPAEALASDAGFDQVSFGADDPFASHDPVGGANAWYDEPVSPSYDVELDEPEDDILDDVDDLHLDD